MSTRGPLLCASLFFLLACGPEGAPGATGDFPDVELHLLTLSRLQGFAEGVPCADETPAPLAVAAAKRAELMADPDNFVLLATVGDALVQPGVVPNNQAAKVAVEARGDVILDAMAEAGVQLYAPAHADFMGGVHNLLDRAAARGLPVVLTNIDVEGRDDIRRSIVIDMHGIKVGCLAVIDKAPQGGASPIEEEGVRIRSPKHRAVLEAERLLREGEAHMIVVFSAANLGANQLMCESPDIHFVIGSSQTGMSADRIVQRDGTSLMHMRTAGRELAHTILRIVDGDTTLSNLSHLYTLPEEIAREAEVFDKHVEAQGTDDPQVLAQRVAPAWVDEFIRRFTLLQENRAYLEEIENHTGSAIIHRRIEEREPPGHPVVEILAGQGAAITEAVMALPELEEFRRLARTTTPDQCQACHPDQYDHWLGTRHAVARSSLVEVGREHDPACLHCHTVGFSEGNGYRDPRYVAPYGEITCTNCHTTALQHVEVPRLVVDPQFVQSREETMSCLTCHSSRRSPGFDLLSALDQVRCPPMDPEDPLIRSARERVIELVESREEVTPRDDYLLGLALLHLGREDEALQTLLRFAEGNEDNAPLAIELAFLFEEIGASTHAADILAAFLGRPENTMDFEVNQAYFRLLLRAKDPAAHDPHKVLTRINLLLPDPYDMKADVAAFRLLQVEALSAIGNDRAARDLLLRLYNNAPGASGVLEMYNEYFRADIPDRPDRMNLGLDGRSQDDEEDAEEGQQP